MAFDALLESLPQLFAQTDAMFTDSRLDNMESEVNDVQLSLNSLKSATVESLGARIMPFDIRSSADAVWDLLMHPSSDFFQGAESNMAYSNDTTSHELRQCVKWGKSHFDLYSKFMSRRYDCPDRVVFVSSGRIEPLMVEDAPVDELVILMMDWTVVEKPRHQGIRQAGGAHISQAHRHGVVTFSVQSRTGEAEHTLLPMAEDVMSAMRADLDKWDHQIENRLLAKALQSPFASG